MIFEGKPFHLGHHRSLDGIRGVAILLVLLVHGEVIPERSYAFIGVNSFFVLSGFLITCLLVQEYDKSNDISLRHFYLRRALRLLPALMTMLLAFVVFVLLTDHGEGAFQKIHQALFALFYSTNLAKILRVYPAVGTSYLDHTWSLSIEEQFYFVWPAILLFLLRKNSRDSLLCWILLGVFLSVCTRVILFSGIVVSRDVNRLGLGPDTRADSLLLGCFVGVLIASNLLPRSDWFTKVLKKVAIISGIGLFIIGIFSPCTPVMIRVGWLLGCIGI